MKKIFAILVTVAMLLSMGAMVTSAVEVPPVSWTPGNYAVADAADFTPVGNLKITWDPEAASKLDLTDGDMADWAAAGYDMVAIDSSNMVSWVGGAAGEVDPAMPANWSISTYFVADADYLYIGFYVTDPVFVYGTAPYNGDAFQVCIDFGGKLGQVVVEDPDKVSNPKNIFYSFTCIEDGKPIEIQRQESDNDAILTEANGDGVKGAAKKTDTGWSAEFALSFQMLYDDYVWKAWEDDPKIYIGSNENLPLKIGCALYYLDRTESGGDVTWAAGTSNGVVIDDAGTPGVSWTCYDNGIQLELDYVDGMEINCSGVISVDVEETTPEETTAEETTAEETDAPTEAPTDAPTEAPTDAATDAPTDAGTDAPTEETKDGCNSVIGFSAVAVLAAAAAAVALKKKD